MTATALRDAFEARQVSKNFGDLTARSILKTIIAGKRRELGKLGMAGHQWSATAATKLRATKAALASEIASMEAMLVSPVQIVLQVSRMAGGAEVLHFGTATRDR